MDQKTLIAAVAVFSFLFLFGCTQQQDYSGYISLCNSTNGSVIFSPGQNIPLCHCSIGNEFNSNLGCIATVQNGPMQSLCEKTGGNYQAADPSCPPCPPDKLCEPCAAGCGCPSGKAFDQKYGCIDQQTLEAAQLCDSSGGRYNYCSLEPCISSCICNPGQQFDSAKGCVAGSDKQLCESTGGQYKNWPCQPCQIGQACPPCGLGCFCGANESFDSQYGCRSDEDVYGPYGFRMKTLCEQTGGSFYNPECLPCPAGAVCAPCAPPSCSCGVDRKFNDTIGCVSANATAKGSNETIPESLQACKRLCEGSGGTFTYCPDGQECFVGTGCGCPNRGYLNCETLASVNGCTGANY